MIVEVNGVKLAVDERTATTVESYKVGDRVKVLHKKYSHSSSYTLSVGVIVGFAPFKERPTIEIMYIDASSFEVDPLKFLHVHEGVEDVEIAPLSEHEVMLDRAEVIEKMTREINKRRTALSDMEHKLRYFEERFAKAFPDLLTPSGAAPMTVDEDDDVLPF